MAPDDKADRRERSPGSRLTRFASLAAVAIAAWTLVTTAACVAVASCDLPYADEWDIWSTRVQQGYSASWFFGLHNDHRIVTTRLLFAIDEVAFHAHIWFPQAVSLLAQAALLLLLWKLARRLNAAGPLDGVLLATLICCLFSAQQSINFMWGFQVQFFLVYAFAAGALSALRSAAEATGDVARGGWMASCLLLATASSYSMANGILIWPVMVLAAIWMRLGRARVTLLAVSGLLIGGLYFQGWHSSPLDSPSPMWRILLFALANAGAPAVPLLRVAGGDSSAVGIAAAAIGWLLLTFVGYTWFQLWRDERAMKDDKPRSTNARMMLAHFAIFVAAASFAIAAGRAHLPLDAAFRSRYITPPYILWVCTLLLVWPRLRAWGESRTGWLVVLALAIGIAPYQLGKLREAGAHGAGLRQASVALAAGVNDPGVWPYLLRPVTDSAVAEHWMHEKRLAHYSAEWTQWIGRQLPSDGSSACPAVSIDVTEIKDAARPGWRISLPASENLKFAVLAGEGNVVQSAAPVIGGRWALYARPGSTSATVYGVRQDGALCVAAREELR